MITQAYIMGTLGKAAFQENGKWFVLRADEPTLPRSWHPFDHNLLSLTDPEILEVQAPQSIDHLSQLLQAETMKQEALTLALQLMDTSIERPDLKVRIAAMLAEYAQEETIAQFLENRLLSTPVPAAFQPSLASNLCRAIQQHRMATLYDLLDYHTDAMEAIRVAWIKIAKEKFESSEQASFVYSTLVEGGHFAALTRALIVRNFKEWDNAISNASRALKKVGIANIAQVLSAISSELIGHFSVHSQEAATSPMLPMSNEHRNIHWERLAATFKKTNEHKFGAAATADGIIANRHDTAMAELAEGSAPADGIIANRHDRHAIVRLKDSLRRDDYELAFQLLKANSSEGKLEAQIRGAKIKMIEDRANEKRVRLAELIEAHSHEREKAVRHKVKAKKAAKK